jgi:prolyl-tRNA editing enzyme YbaK/EbsC (Cys-tRNA(Pro) deacylase)
MEPLTTVHVQEVLKQYDIEVMTFEESTATSEMAAQAIGCELGQIAKSLCFIVDSVPVLVIASGDQRVDTKKLADIRGVARKRVKVAKPEECIEIFGYAPGGVPPVAHRTENLPIYFDDSLKRYEMIYAAAGASNINFGVETQRLIDITGGEVINIRQES